MNNLEKFRKETKNWLDKNCPPSMRSGADPDIPIDEVWEEETLSIKIQSQNYG